MQENEAKNSGKRDFAKALENCTNILARNEFSRTTGVRLELLRRFINRQARSARAETWDKIYPALKPLFEEGVPEVAGPLRIGPAARRNPELVEMFSDQKVLLDEFAVLPEFQRKQAIARFESAAGGAAPSDYKSLDEEENRIMGAFLALDPENRQKELLILTQIASAEVRRRRREAAGKKL